MDWDYCVELAIFSVVQHECILSHCNFTHSNAGFEHFPDNVKKT